MSESDPVGAEPSAQRLAPRARRRLRRLGATALIVVGGGLVVWSERRTIAVSVIDRRLAEAEVRARYRIVDLGLGRQRLVDVAIGDPARPDLAADWIELRTRLGLDGVRVTAVSAGGLRLRATLRDGRLSLGELDRLLPTSSGADGFRLPAVDLSVASARADLATPMGAVQLVLSGSGRLDDGFRGRASAASGQLAVDGCTARQVSLAVGVDVDHGAVTLTGPLGADRIACRGGAVARPIAEVEATFAPGLTRWRGEAAIRAARLTALPFATEQPNGRVSFAGTAQSTAGSVALAGGGSRLAQIESRGVAVSGRYRVGAETGFAGAVRATGLAPPADLLAAVRRQRGLGAGTPAAPLVTQAADALARAAEEVDAVAQVRVAGGDVAITRLDASSRSGARVSVIADAPVSLNGGLRQALRGSATIGGGGLPSATVRFARAAAGQVLGGTAVIAPYSAGAARLALAPVRFAWNGDRGRVETLATLSGPLADGRIEGLRLPIAAAWGERGVRVDPGCVTVAFDRLTVASLRLAAARAPVCAVAGGVRVPSLTLAGTLGASPLELAAGDVRVSLGERRIAAADVSARLGATRLEIAQWTASSGLGGIGGRIGGASGRIGQVPVVLSDGAGAWRLAGGTLTLDADATLSDAAPAARFKPVRAQAIKLRLEGGTIDATATLVTPERATRVAEVTIAHDLARGTGEASFAIPDLMFDDALQPDALTPLTFGVIADVRGTVRGDARIGWGPGGVTSSGTLRTDGLDLAAAFGPVRGLAGTIRFTDLLALETAPDQVATIASINPGVPVEDGQVVYRLLPDGRIAIAGGHWPFAGGSLDLRPTTFAFGAAGERRLTFALTGIDAGRFLQQFDFENLSATGTFDGTLPMIFDASGGRIEGGELRVRPGGGNLAYLGELTKKDLGTWGTLAFQALRSIDYRDLAITMNGPLAGEMITEVRFAGISQGKGARSNFLIRRLQKLPFVFNIRIRAPFRGLIDSAQSFYDPTRLIARNLPRLIERQNRVAPPAPIQPRASEPRP